MKKSKAIPIASGSVPVGEDPPPAQSLTVEQKDKMDIQDQIFEMIISEHEDEQDSMSIKCEPRRVEDEMECLSLLKEWSSMPSADDFERFIIERELPSSTGQLKQEDKHARDLDVPLPVMTGDKQDSALVCTKLREIPARKAEKEVNEEVKNLGVATAEMKAEDGSLCKNKMETDKAGPS